MLFRSNETAAWAVPEIGMGVYLARGECSGLLPPLLTCRGLPQRMDSGTLLTPKKEGSAQKRPGSWGFRPVRTCRGALPYLSSLEPGATLSLPRTGSEPAKPGVARTRSPYPSPAPPHGGRRPVCPGGYSPQTKFARRVRRSSQHPARGSAQMVLRCPRSDGPRITGTAGCRGTGRESGL